MDAKEIIALFGGQSALAVMLGKGQSTVAYWSSTGIIPAKWQGHLMELAAQHKIPLTAENFITTKKPAVQKDVAFSNLTVLAPPKLTTASQTVLDLGIRKQIEIDGIGMGVLSDGTPYLTGRGLSRLCGVVHSVIQDITTEWEELVAPPRVTRIREILASHGEAFTKPFIAIQQRNGVVQAYPDAVCLAILEYYSFDAGLNIRQDAQKNYRLLAGKALREFIYTQVGYDPTDILPKHWKVFHDRVSLTYNSVPPGYFGIFKEISDMIVTLGQAGLHIDESFVPDISVGSLWAKHWCAQNADEIYGSRIKFDHNYPDYFPQAISNPQDSWCYPESALGEFRRWFRDTYIGAGKFQDYVERKAKEKKLPISFAQLAIAAYTQ